MRIVRKILSRLDSVGCCIWVYSVFLNCGVWSVLIKVLLQSALEILSVNQFISKMNKLSIWILYFFLLFNQFSGGNGKTFLVAAANLLNVDMDGRAHGRHTCAALAPARHGLKRFKEPLGWLGSRCWESGPLYLDRTEWAVASKSISWC